MAGPPQSVALSRETVQQIQSVLRDSGLDGWLLYDFHDANPVSGGLLGLRSLSRRYFVLIPASGEPVALTHRIEQQPWADWWGGKRIYLEWRELRAELGAMLAGFGRVAMEYSPLDGVPYADRVPAGVVELVREAGPQVVSSADLISAFYARWSADGEASHRRAASTLQQTARAAFLRAADAIRSGEPTTEWELKGWIADRLRDGGLQVGADSIVAIGPNAANPHYVPSATSHATIARGDALLIDLWGKERRDSVYADQTWMAYMGEDAVPDRLEQVWRAVRDGRDAGVALLRERHAATATVSGGEVDDAVRAVIVAAGLGEYFIHRTGHSIDRELHGSGPNIDNLETRDTRTLIAGIGFSIEPGVYLAGELGVRSEIDLFMGPNGPEVTTPEPQRELFRPLAGG